MATAITLDNNGEDVFTGVNVEQSVEYPPEVFRGINVEQNISNFFKIPPNRMECIPVRQFAPAFHTKCDITLFIEFMRALEDLNPMYVNIRHGTLPHPDVWAKLLLPMDYATLDPLIHYLVEFYQESLPYESLILERADRSLLFNTYVYSHSELRIRDTGIKK